MPDTTQVKVIREFNSRYYSEDEITRKIRDEGWIYLSVRVERPARDEDDGSFKEHFVYLLGTTDEAA